MKSGNVGRAPVLNNFFFLSFFPQKKAVSSASVLFQTQNENSTITRKAIFPASRESLAMEAKSSHKLARNVYTERSNATLV